MTFFDTGNILLYTMIFILGSVIGSFLNVVIYRLGSGSGLYGRSKCLSCGKALTPLMLIPLVSFLVQRGRCAYCGARISWQYPAVELTAGLLFVVAAYKDGIDLNAVSLQASSLFLFDAAVLMTLLAVTVYDFRHKIIPDRLSFLFAAFSLCALLLRYHFGIFPERYISVFETVPWWIDLAAAPLIALPFVLLWLLSAGRAMGLGDGKLAWGLGWWLGFAGGVSGAIFAFWIAFFPGVALLFMKGKGFTMKSEIPFAPFLVLGALVVYIFHIDIFSWTF